MNGLNLINYAIKILNILNISGVNATIYKNSQITYE